MRIKEKMDFDTFRNVCENKGITDFIEIKKRWDNYTMAFGGLSDGRTSHEVGAGIKEEDLEDEA